MRFEDTFDSRSVLIILGDTIRRERERKGLSIGALSQLSGYSRNTLSRVEYGEHNICYAGVVKLARGLDPTIRLFNGIKPRLLQIMTGGFFDNSKGRGHIAPKDVGDTLESLLGIETNNRHDADYEGLIELKAKGDSRTLDTLFTLRPHFEGTRVAQLEPDDRSRVSAFARLYGYASEKHPGCMSLYITIGSYEAPQNNQGFYLQVREKPR